MQFRHLLHGGFTPPAHICRMLQKIPNFSKDAHRILEWGLIVGTFALAMVFIAYGMK